MSHPKEHQALMEVLRGNEAAVAFCEALGWISQTWDDLHDGDRYVSPEDVNRAFWRCLIELPNNPFYRANQDSLQPLMQSAIIDWLDANTLEKQGDHEQNVAFVLRDNLAAVVIHCALLVGGYDWVRKVSPVIRMQLVHDEPLDNYKARLHELG